MSQSEFEVRWVSIKEGPTSDSVDYHSQRVLADSAGQAIERAGAPTDALVYPICPQCDTAVFMSRDLRGRGIYICGCD